MLQEPNLGIVAFHIPQTIPRMKVKEIRFAVTFGAGKGTQQNKGNKNQAMTDQWDWVYFICLKKHRKCTRFFRQLVLLVLGVSS